MISDAALARLERAVKAERKDGWTDVRADDVFVAIREIRANRRMKDKYDDLKRALATVGEALRDEL